MTTQPTALRLADDLCDVHTTHVARNAAAELRRLHAEVEALRADYHKACGLVADMHAAAMGQMVGPNRGVVEDVEDLRLDAEKLRHEVEALRADAERYRWLRGNARATSEHWGGRWSLVIEGPAPGGNAPAASIDAAIDAARERT